MTGYPEAIVMEAFTFKPTPLEPAVKPWWGQRKCGAGRLRI